MGSPVAEVSYGGRLYPGPTQHGGKNETGSVTIKRKGDAQIDKGKKIHITNKHWPY